MIVFFLFDILINNMGKEDIEMNGCGVFNIFSIL